MQSFELSGEFCSHFHHYLGVWCIHHSVFFIAVRNENLHLQRGNNFETLVTDPIVLSYAEMQSHMPKMTTLAGLPEVRENELRLTKGGTAILPILGVTMKGYSKWGGTSTVGVRRALRTAEKSKKVKRALLYIDSPGGAYAGNYELADDLRAFSRRKPLETFASDNIASAAYWFASATPRITINHAGQGGAIGTYMTITDSSKRAENEGLKVHLIASGPHKGQGAEGVPITDEHVKHLQKRVNEANTLFLASVKKGRPNVEIEKVADGRDFSATDMLELKLVDSIDTFENTLERFEESTEPPPQVTNDKPNAASVSQRIKSEWPDFQWKDVYPECKDAYLER